ncbi:MAG: hypothetical protein ABDK94_05010 [Atribacterota bacterium]
MSFRFFLLAILSLILFLCPACASRDHALDFPVLEPLDFEEGLVFFEKQIHIEGEPGPPYIFIDFPTYRFREEEGTLTSFNGAFGSEEGKVNPYAVDLIVGKGISLSGSAGSGATSGLLGITDFPFVSGVLSVREMRPDGSLLIQKGNPTITFFELTFPNPIPPETLLIRPGERLEYSITKNCVLSGTTRRLTLRVILRCAFIKRENCRNGSWADM